MDKMNNSANANPLTEAQELSYADTFLEKKQIIDGLMDISHKLDDVYKKLRDINKVTQFDYVTNSKLGDEWSIIESQINMIGHIIWQKRR